MKEEAQRIAIAKQCGWTAKQDADGFWRAIHPRGHEAFEKWVSESNVWSAGIPDYPSDLNAMHEAEGTLQERDDRRYKHYLAAVCVGKPTTIRLKDTDRLNVKALIVALRATAAQRAEAFLRTLNLWKD